MKRAIIPILISIVALVFMFSYQTGALSDKKLFVVFCDVGQGDAIYIRTPQDTDILIDGGRGNQVLKCLSNNMPVWDREIELVFATHPDADHITGLIAVLNSYKIGSFNSVAAPKNTKVYGELRKLIEKYKIPYKNLSIGDKFRLSDGVSIETKWPAKGFTSKDTNDYSLVQHLKFGEFDLLLTGDISFQILNSLKFGSESIEVLKLPHHGSKTGVDSSTFEKIKASVAIISAGKNNSYHHPHPSVLALLKKFGIDYKRTDEDNSIKIVTDGKSTKVVN